VLYDVFWLYFIFISTCIYLFSDDVDYQLRLDVLSLDVLPSVSLNIVQLDARSVVRQIKVVEFGFSVSVGS